MERRLARLSHTLRTVGRSFPSGCSGCSGFSGLSCSRQLGWRAASPSCLACPASPVCPSWSVLFAPARPAPSRLPVLSCLPCLSCSHQLGWRASVRKILTTENLEFNISKTGFRPSEARFFMLSRPKNTVPRSKTVNLALQNSLSYAPKQSILHAKIVNLTLPNSPFFAPYFSTPHTLSNLRKTQNTARRTRRHPPRPFFFVSRRFEITIHCVSAFPVRACSAGALLPRSSRAPPACSPSPR